MKKLRNISGEDLIIEIRGRWQKVANGGLVTVPDDKNTYWQTGEQGEEALWEIVPDAKTKGSLTKKEEV